MLSFLDDEARRNPHPLYAAFRKGRPVLRDPQSGLWLIFDHAGVKRALTDHETFSSTVRPPAGQTPDWLIFNDPPRHSRLRVMYSRAFTPRTIAGLEPEVRDLSRQLLAVALAHGEIDLVTEYADLLPALVIGELLGVAEADRRRFLGWCEAFVGLATAQSDGIDGVAGIAAHAVALEELKAYLAFALEERRRAPTGDLLTRLVQAEVDGDRLSGDEILGFVHLLILAGTETVTNAIGNAFLCFLEHPAELARLRARPELLASAFEEVLRYRSPAQLVHRQATRDVDLGGTIIPSLALVLAVVGSANRDPMAFTDPDRFDIGRDPNPHLALGHGIHFCIGAPLARLEARVALADLLERLGDFRLASSEPWPPRKGLLIHGPARLPLRVR